MTHEKRDEKIPCSVEVLTLNSAVTLARCLNSIRDFADIIVLDGNSTDDTVAIATSYGARVYSQTDTATPNTRIDDFSAVRNRGLQFAKFQWFLYIDSDEYLSSEAVAEMRAIIARGQHNTYFIYNLPRRYIIDGSVVHQIKPSYQTRFFYLPAVDGFVKKVHERIKPKSGYAVGVLTHPEYVPLESIRVLRKKWQRYLDIQQSQYIDISLTLFFKKLRANLKKSFKYALKASYVLVTWPKNGRLFYYEYYNAWYHIQLIKRLLSNVVHNILTHK